MATSGSFAESMERLVSYVALCQAQRTVLPPYLDPARNMRETMDGSIRTILYRMTSSGFGHFIAADQSTRLWPLTAEKIIASAVKKFST
jgi:hypothetical protein